MSQDLEQYSDIIEQLKPMINEPEFDQILTQVAASISKQKRFLLKMELKRLARPCIRLIDLRGHVDGKCRKFVYENKEHYLDDMAIDVFERQVRSFGQYTIGVYEAVTSTENNYRVMHSRLRETGASPAAQKRSVNEVTPSYFAPKIEFGNFAQRSEERMNYAMTVEILSELNKSVPAITVDVSVSGLKIKVSKEHLFKAGERLSVLFRGMENEFLLDKRQGLQYLIEGIDRSKDEQRLNLKRVTDIASPGFDKFFESFIHGNKRRYKVNMDNTFDAIHNKTYEQYYIPNFTSIPLFIDHNAGVFTPRYALGNDCNREDISFWSNEVQELKIGYLLSDERIKRCLTLPKGRQETFVYVFNHIKNEKIYFYSATQEELDGAPHLKKVFLGYGARKASWRVYKLQFNAMQPQQSHRPLSIADAVSESVKRQNQHPVPRLMSKLQHLSHIALLTNITDTHNTESYQHLKFTRAELAELKIFAHPRNRSPAIVSTFRFRYANQRRETRFLLRSKILLTIDDVVFEGNTEDVSVNGLRLELNTFFHRKMDTSVQVSFPQLQNVTKKYVLSDLPYQVKNISQDQKVLHLGVVNDPSNNATRLFFDELIKKNRATLKAYRDEEDIPGIGEALRNIYSRNVLNVAFFIRKEGARYLPDATATWSTHTRLTTLLSFQAQSGQLNLYPLFEGMAGKLDFIASTLNRIKTNQRPVMRELFVAFAPDKTVIGEAIKSCFVEQFDNDQQRSDFISRATKTGQFIAIKVFLSRTGRPDIATLQSEINYVGVYALHRAKILEEKLWSVSGIGDLIDVTDEVMQRLGCSASAISENQQVTSTKIIESPGIAQLLKA
ncbi:MAG: hypothetical protein ACJA13_000859 [Paraglaciecola sp.]|jgi:hypothetical protein